VQTLKINWDASEETPSDRAAAPVVTGVLAKKSEPKKGESEWTVDQLKAGKPLLVYYFAEVTDPMDEYYKFARKFEMSALHQDTVDQLNKSWRATKRTVDVEADRKAEKNQVRIEFWSFTGKKMDVVTLKSVLFGRICGSAGKSKTGTVVESAGKPIHRG
jgi:hypothetical protein